MAAATEVEMHLYLKTSVTAGADVRIQTYLDAALTQNVDNELVNLAALTYNTTEALK